MKFSEREKWFLLFGMGLAYLLVIPFAIQPAGYGVLFLAFIPIALAGWFFGLNGILLSILCYIIADLIYFLAFEGKVLQVSPIWMALFGIPFLSLAGFIVWRLEKIYESRLKIEIVFNQRLREANALADIGRALSETERVGLDDVLQLIVDSANDLIPGTEQAVIHLLDQTNQMLISQAAAGFEKPDLGRMQMRMGEGVAGQVIASRKLFNIGNVESDPRFLQAEQGVNFKSLMVAPIQSGTQILGTISVQSPRINAFVADAERLLNSLSTQAAIAIENANLLQTTQQGLKEVNALYQISRGLAASLNTEELMVDVADLLYQSLRYYHVQIFTRDPASGSLAIQVESPFSDARGERPTKLVSAGAGIVGHVMETGKPFFTNSVEDVLFLCATNFYRIHARSLLFQFWWITAS